jgi:hypothetical protein
LLSPNRAFSAVTEIFVHNSEHNRRVFYQLIGLFTQAIAFDELPTATFYRLCGLPNPVARAFWQRFLAAQRVMRKLGLQAQSIPDNPDVSEHLDVPFKKYSRESRTRLNLA